MAGTGISASSLAVSGLASGMDWQTTVSQLIAVERSGYEDPLNAQKTSDTNRLSALTTIKSDLTNLQTAANTLKNGTSGYYTRKVTEAKNTSATVSNLNATADGSTPLGTYNFNITQLATATTLTGSKIAASLDDPTKTLANLDMGASISAGNFTVNGKTITVATTDTLQSVFDQISTATGGEVTGALSGGKVVLTGHDIGNGQPRITLGSSADTSNFLEATQLYSDTGTGSPVASISSANPLGSANVDTALTNSLNTGSLTGLTNGTGTFTINGKTITYNTSTSSIRSIMGDINNSGAGVLVNYDTGSGNLIVTNQQTGTLGISTTDTTGILAQLGLTSGAGATSTYGKNAQFKINGSATVLTSNSNTLTSDITGIPGLSVTANDTGSDNVTVAADTTQAQTNIQTFITAYNDLNTDVNAATKITLNADGTVSTSPLSGNHDVQDFLTSIRQKLFQTVNTGNSKVSSVFQIGLDFSSSDGSLSITDQTALTNAFSSDPNAVAKIFNGSGSNLGDGSGNGPANATGSGVANTIYSYIQGLINSTGIYTTQVNNINTDVTSINAQLAKLETKITNDQTTLTNSFQSMESALSNIQNQGKLMNSIIGGTSTTG